MNLIYERISKDTEFSQSIVRVVIGSSCMAYVHIIANFDIGRIYGYDTLFYPIVVLWFLAASILTYSIYKWPGSFPLRRIFAVLIDFWALIYLLSGGEEKTLPIYAFMVSVTLGHGIRYGPNYLIFSVCTALAVLIFLTATNSYWIDNPYLVATLFFTVLLTPAYALALLRQSRRALILAEQADREKSKFLASASHDLRQPVHAIGLLAAQLADSDLSKAQQGLVSDIERSVEGATDLFQSLLNISIIEAGGIKPQYSPVSVQDIFDDLGRQNHVAAAREDINLRILKSRLVVSTDQILIMTMLQNIVSNAIKYAPGKDILIGHRRRGKTVSIWICDRGAGIPQHDLSHISDEFYRVDNHGPLDVEGSGLGLAIVKRLANLMNLRMEIRSELKRGTLVIIHDIPISSEEPGGQVSKQHVNPKQLSGMRVLLVDDDEQSLKATEKLLLNWGCEVDVHTRFPVSPKDCDVILTDFDFGDNGTLKDHMDWLLEARSRGVQIVVISAHSSAIVEKAMGWKNLVILSKPLKPAALRSFLMAQKLVYR